MIIIEDKREITRIELFSYYSSDIVSYTSSKEKGIKIVPYHENGELAPVIWFAIIKNEDIVARINSKYVQIIGYKD